MKPLQGLYIDTSPTTGLRPSEEPIPRQRPSEDGSRYEKVKTCPLCFTDVVTTGSQKGGRPREFHPNCAQAWGILKRLEFFIENAEFDSSRQSRLAGSMLRSRLWTLANKLNSHGHPVSIRSER